MKTGFIYCWTNTRSGMKYIGRHQGSLDDGYIASSKIFRLHYDKDPSIFVREILFIAEAISSEDIVKQEAVFLDIIPNDELYYGSNPKYYNICKNASGYTSDNNPMKIPEIAARMKQTQKETGCNKGVYNNTVQKYGIEKAREMNRTAAYKSSGGKSLAGRGKSEEHKRKISEAIKNKHTNGDYLNSPLGRKKKRV